MLPSTANPAQRTIPLRGAFAAACLGVIAAFALVAALSDELFFEAITHVVSTKIEVAIRQSMEVITDPLDTSEQLVERLRDKIEMYPSSYAIDDVDPTSLAGNPSSHMFVADAVLASLQRPTISVFQVCQSTRYEHSPGHPMDTFLEVNQLTVDLSANNTATIIALSSKAALANLSVSLPTTIHHENISGVPHITKAYATSDLRWVASAFGIPDLGIATTSMLTIYGHIRTTAQQCAIGIDHNMSALEELLLQGTVPFTFGTHDPNKVVEAGAHTSLYDMHLNTFVSTSIRTVPIFKGDNELWPAGEVPHDQVNSAYREALALCSAHHSCIDEPAVEIIDEHVISAFRVRREGLDLDLMIVSSAPRKYFFDEADKSLIVSISVSVVACVLVVCGCVGLLVCMRPALHRLQSNMLLASDLQNDLVEHTSSVLTEIADLSAVFDEMNKRLLVARSFVPEAVLLGQDNTQDDEGSVTAHLTAGNNGSVQSSMRSSQAAGRGIYEMDTSNADTPTSTVVSSERIARLFVMNEKRVAVLALNLVGFGSLISNESSAPRLQRINNLTTRLLSAVATASKEEKGVMDSFHGDHFILTFNASRAVAGSLAAAVRTAVAVQEEIASDTQFRGSLGVAAGASIGRAHVGTLGIDGHRRLSIISPAYRTAISLQGVCSQYMMKTAEHIHHNSNNQVHIPTTGCVLEEKSLKEIDSSSCGICVQLIGHATHPVTYKDRQTKVYAAHCVSSHKDVEDDEWLYQLGAMEAADPFLNPNRAVEALLAGDLELCAQIVQHNSQSESLAASMPSSLGHSVNSQFDIMANNSGTSLVSSTHQHQHHQHQRSVWAMVEFYLREARNVGGHHHSPHSWNYILS